jgi:hypothetical protein
LGKIIITDAAGKSFTLYSAEGENDLSKFELPPSPPAGVFDVRFSSGRYAENLAEETRQIDLNGIVYPFKVKTEGLDLKLQDETGKIVNARIKNGNEILINQNINKLLVSKDVIPNKFALYQNYPNPFNPTTVIKYQIPKDGIVTLKIYDILGREVKILVNEQKFTGRYEVKFDATDLASGIYIYRIQVNDYTSSKKMMLIK